VYGERSFGGKAPFCSTMVVERSQNSYNVLFKLFQDSIFIKSMGMWLLDRLMPG
jgi:hypothetical protein